MSALSAAASDEDGDTIKQLRAAIEQARDWIAEHPDRRPISAGRMVAILTNALADAPQPPVVEQPQGEQEPVAYCVASGASPFQIFRSKSQADSLAHDLQKRHDLAGSPAHFYVIPLYAHLQPPRQPLTDEEIRDVAFDVDAAYGSVIEFARAIERVHGIGGEE